MTNRALPLIESIGSVRKELRQDAARLSRLEELQHWQLGRLRRTYEDCYQDARYRDALDFFMRDLYGPHDFTDRDRDLRKVLGAWEKALPQRALEAITSALELESLTLSLDLSMLEHLPKQPLTEATYANSYRACDRADERARQIALIIGAGRSLDELITKPWVGAAIKVARTPAKLARVTVLHDFLERGFDSFAKMGRATELLQIIEERETSIMKNLFAGTPKPFAVS